MKENGQNKETQIYGSFFKKAAKKKLPTIGAIVLASVILFVGCEKQKKCDCVTTIYTSPVIQGDHILTIIDDGECSDLDETTYDQWFGRVEKRCTEVPMNTQYVIDGGSISY